MVLLSPSLAVVDLGCWEGRSRRRRRWERWKCGVGGGGGKVGSLGDGEEGSEEESRVDLDASGLEGVPSRVWT